MHASIFYFYFLAFVAALGGFLFGFNTSVISAAILFIAKEFTLTRFDQETVVSIVLISALIGAFLGGILADRFGRKRALEITIAFFLLGSILLYCAHGFWTLVLGRLVLGFGIGITSLAAPLYIAEIAPSEKRGLLVSFNQFLITIGILVGYIVGYIGAADENWRGMVLFGIFPAILQGALLLFIPETTSQDKNGCEGEWKHLFLPPISRPFFIGIGVSLLQQITGINGVIYYGPQIFQMNGYSAAEEAIFATVLIGLVNVIATAISLWLIDRLGRRLLMLIGLSGMALALFFLPLMQGSFSLISVMVYIAFFAISLGPCAWLVISEIYPKEIRGRAMGVAIGVNWLSNYLVSFSFLSFLDHFGSLFTFWLYGVISLFGFWFVWKLVPETKGKTLEEIQTFWKKQI